MTIVVEDGTGITGAESYIDRSFFDDFCIAWGLGDPTDADESAAEGAMRRGTLVFDTVYGPRFPGVPLSSTQGLLFPMTELVDRRNYQLPPLPVQVKQATAVLALQELTSPMSLFPVVTPGKIKKSITADKISVDYDVSNGGTGYISGARPVLSIVEGILAPIGGSTNVGARPLYGSAERG